MGAFLTALFTGLRLGSVYALVALGYTMVYGIIKLINFAHGDFIMVGAYALFFTVPILKAAGVPAWLGVIAAVIVCAAVGMATELAAYRPVRKTGTNMTALITAIAVSLVLENLAQAIPAIGPNPRTVDSIFAAGGVSISGATLSWATLITIIVSLVIMLVLYTFTRSTKLGRAMRAVSEDKQAATLMGISVNSTILITFAIGAGLAGVAALMYVAQYPAATNVMGATLGLYAFVAAGLGGIGSIPGAMLGGFVIGLIYSFSSAYISSSLASTFVYLILIAVLLVKPEGMLGKNVGEKV